MPSPTGGAGVIQGVPRLGLPAIQLADSAAATWDLKRGFEFGEVIGRELRDQMYNSSIGGGVDLMREPRNGRNFEYFGEDPILAGKMAAQLVTGLQARKSSAMSSTTP